MSFFLRSFESSLGGCAGLQIHLPKKRLVRVLNETQHKIGSVTSVGGVGSAHPPLIRFGGSLRGIRSNAQALSRYEQLAPYRWVALT